MFRHLLLFIPHTILQYTQQQLTLAQVEERLSATALATLSSGAALSLCVELLTAVYVDVVGK